MNYYYQQQLKRQSLANNDKNPSISPERQQQQQFINREQSPNTPNSFVTMTYKPYLLREDGEQKIPLFLIKLWNIVEDPSHWEVIRWDETGLSFHIMKPYVFCSDILPYYFKHKNLNSLVRQLNMYGFRKNTPIERSGLARAESDQDHLEFFHPFFRRDHPELLVNIHRKVPNSAKQQGHHQPPPQQQKQLQLVANVAEVIGGPTAMDVGREETVTMRTNDLTNIFDELRDMRERQKNMEIRMDEMTKENEMLWNEMAHIRGTHLKQQQIVNKLIQFLVALVGPAAAAGKQSHRLGKKRHMYVLEDFGAKRLREFVGDGSGSVPSPASVPMAGESGGGTSGGAGTVNASSIYSTTGRFPPSTCSTATSAAPAMPTATSIVPGAASTSANGPPVSTTTTHASQLQSILPSNATEILDRLISEIATSRTGDNGVRLTDGAPPTTMDRYRIGDDIQIDDLSSPLSADSSNNDQQLQSYVASGNNFGTAPSTTRPPRSNSMHTPPSNSGPIIAEVTEDFEGLSPVDQNIDTGIRMPVQSGVVPPNPLSMAQQQPVEQHHQFQQPIRNYQSYINDVVGQRRQQPKYAKKDTNGDGMYHQQQTQREQQLVVYQPTQHQLIQLPISQQRPKQPQQQQLVILQGQPTATTVGHCDKATAQPTGKQPQQQSQQITTLTPPLTQQQRISRQNSSLAQSSMTAHLGQQSNTANELQSILSTPPPANQDLQNAAPPSLSDGMMLNDAEMADIAGLNAFLDQNNSRFNSLTNSIGEHWVNGVDDSDLQLQDLFQSVEDLSANTAKNAAPDNRLNDRPSQIPADQHHFFNDDDHLDFPFELENENGVAI